MVYLKGGNMHLFYESFEPVQAVLWIVWVFSMIAFNDFARRNLKTGIFTFFVLPVILLLFVWPNTSPGSNVMSWFFISKLTAILAFAWIIMALRYSTRVQNIKWFKYLVPLLLIINMIEAIVKELEVASYSPGIHEGLYYIGGTWNVLNAVAGIINIILITGFIGIYISKDKTKTMVWPDMSIWWIIAYDLWNFTYLYNCIGDRSFYVLGILVAATYAAHFCRKGAWMQHRVFTLAINMMIVFTIPNAFSNSVITVHSTWNPTANWILSGFTLLFNIGLLIYQVYYIMKTKRNPYTEELYIDSKEYQDVVRDDRLREGNEIVEF